MEARFHRVTERRGWATANQAVSMLRSIYRRSSIDHEGLRNPVELWIASGGRLASCPLPTAPAPLTADADCMRFAEAGKRS